MSKIPTFSLLFLLPATILGCPGTLDDPSRFFPQECADVETTLLVPRCGTLAGCHVADAPAGDLDLTSADIAARVVGVPATIACGGGFLADPASPETSILYLKVTDAPPCGSRMPLGGDDLTEAEQTCLLAWIAAQSP